MDKKGEVFNPGPALGFYLAFKKLNSIIPDDVLNIKLGLISKNSQIQNFLEVYLDLIESGFQI